MTCPKCGYEKTTVVDSRHDCESVQRRRKCLDAECGYTFNTVELEGDLLERLVKDDERT